VILDDRVGVGVDDRAGLRETIPELFQLLLAALRSRGHERFDPYAARRRVGELGKNLLVVAAEQRQRNGRTCRPDDFQYRRAAFFQR
jgi:hypothetical protein